MKDLITPSEFAALFRNRVPLLDVRAPAEFNRGAFPASVNIPLLNDGEREQVGTAYKQQGRKAAIDLGHALVSNETREGRLSAWQEFIRQNPAALLYCFRGGQRSSIVQQWLAETGVYIPRIAGGYKGMRRFLLDTLEQQAGRDQFIVVAGKTGSAKTHSLRQLPIHLDLEGRAAHRGSAFGTLVNKQPNQINFENSLAIDFLRLSLEQANRIFIEDESHAIGSLSVPYPLYLRMGESPVALIEEPLDSRSEVICRDYIQDNFEHFRKAHPADYRKLFSDYLLGSLAKIQKRLGGERHARIRAMMAGSLESHLRHGDHRSHENWIRELLRDYYDPMYEYQMHKKLSRTVFHGNRKEFLQWAHGVNANTGPRVSVKSG